jgi:hypothetical protein
MYEGETMMDQFDLIVSGFWQNGSCMFIHPAPGCPE